MAVFRRSVDDVNKDWLEGRDKLVLDYKRKFKDVSRVFVFVFVFFYFVCRHERDSRLEPLLPRIRQQLQKQQFLSGLVVLLTKAGAVSSSEEGVKGMVADDNEWINICVWDCNPNKRLKFDKTKFDAQLAEQRQSRDNSTN